MSNHDVTSRSDKQVSNVATAIDTTQRVAVLDLGSNSFHLTLAEVGPQGIKTYHRDKHKVRLAAGLNEDGLLDQAAIDRALHTLDLFGQILDDFKPDVVKAVATYTFRAAKNIQELIIPARKVLPYPIEVIPGIEEARLIYQGVAHNQYRSGRCLVVDIGGGSTELIIGEQLIPLRLHSCNMGCVSFAELFFQNGAITQGAFAKAIVYAEQELESLRTRYLATGWQTAIGSSGTIKALSQAAVSLKLSDGTLTLPVLQALRDRLVQASNVDNIDIPDLAEDRKGVICSGLAVLLAVFEFLDVNQMTYSDSALREGVLVETQERLLLHHDNRHQTVQLLATRFSCDQDHAGKVRQTALDLFDAVCDAWQLEGNHDYRNLLDWACQLHEIGHQVNHLACHKHAAYIITHSNLAGFDQEQQAILAFLLLSQRKSLKLSQAPELKNLSLQKTLLIALLLRLAVRLNQFRQSEALHSYSVFTPDENSLELHFQPQWKAREALFLADLKLEQAQFKPLNICLDFHFLQDG